MNRLTIVIPAKNEVGALPLLLASLATQDYPDVRAVPVIVADAWSTDGTAAVAESFRGRLTVRVVPGGIPSVGRNAGAREARSEYILFLDADVELRDSTFLRRAVALADRRALDCVTADLKTTDGNVLDNLVFAASNFAVRAARIIRMPFGVGTFLLFRKRTFDRLGGFNERVLFAEDFELTKRVPPKRFAVVPGRVYTSGRRFRKIGRWGMVRLFVQTALRAHDSAYFTSERHRRYWS
ncbi:MAG: glycosyltransferase [bacterium]|nr:glycosyltransferase [bacterium]